MSRLRKKEENPRDFDNQIIIQRPVLTPDEFGGQTSILKSIHQCRANINQMNANEKKQNDSLLSTSILKIMIRTPRINISESDLVCDQNTQTTYDIQSVVSDNPRSLYLTIIAVKRSKTQ